MSGDSALKLKAVILIGGPAKGTRFRPLSLELPKPLFPVGGFPIIYHHIEACSKIKGLCEIILIGFFDQSNEGLRQFIHDTQEEFEIQIRYLQEFTCLGTAGGLYHFRDQIQSGSPDYFFVMNSDVCCDFPLDEMLAFHQNLNKSEAFLIMTTEAIRQQTNNYGCIVEDKTTHEILHYVEKPDTFVSTTINCGIYLFVPTIFKYLRVAFLKHQEENFNFDYKQQCKETIHLEKEVFKPLAGTGKLFVYHTDKWWSQIKSPGAVIYANRHCLDIYHRTHPKRLALHTDEGPTIIGDVFIHPTAIVDSTAVLGPNVSVGRYVSVGPGVRLRECIVLQGSTLRMHACLLNCVIGWGAIVGEWTRIEGTPNDPNPNKPFAKLETLPVFNSKGQLNPSITVIGSNVDVPREVVILNSIVLPHKELPHSYSNQIIL